MTIVSDDGRFEWDSGKDEANRKNIFSRLMKSLTFSTIQLFWRLKIRNTLIPRKDSEVLGH